MAIFSRAVIERTSSVTKTIKISSGVPVRKIDGVRASNVVGGSNAKPTKPALGSYQIVSADTVRVNLINGMPIYYHDPNTHPGGEPVGAGTTNPVGATHVRYMWTVTIDYNTNTPPTTPGDLVYNTTGVLGGQELTIRWGSSTDAEDNLSGYELEVNVGGTTWQSIAKTGPTTLLYKYRIIKGSASVQFRVRAFDSEGLTSEYTTGPIVDVVNNTGPVISAIEGLGDRGNQNHPFEYTYQVIDPDDDQVTVTESLNGVIFKTLQNAPQGVDIKTNITAEMILELTTNKENKITIKAEDGHGHIAYKYITFTRTNQAPIITSAAYELGEKTKRFDHKVNVKDPDGDTMQVSWEVNGVKLGSTEVVSEGDVDITIPNDVFVRLRPGQHSIRVEADDGRGGKAARNFTFTRVVNRVHVKFTHRSKAIDAKPNYLLLVPTWKVAEGAIPKVLVSNNADDETPTWEDATNAVLAGIKHPFTNETKTADVWRVAIQVFIEKGTSKEMSYLSGLGGAIE